MTRDKVTICLAMIVRNEAPVIERCLTSVLPLIDSWVVVDTGSTDGTQTLVRDILTDVPGELVERPWVDFAHNRTEALALARRWGTYTLVIDADEVLSISGRFRKDDLRADSYAVPTRYGQLAYHRTHLLNNDLPWRYEGVLHEYPFCAEAGSPAPLQGLEVIVHHDGARARDPLTYRRDALVLEEALLREPDHPRYQFYLAQSYRDAGDLELARRHYQRRADLGGWPEEVWYSRYQIACIREASGGEWGESLAAYLAAFETNPLRAEPLHRIGLHYLANGDPHSALIFLDKGLRLPAPGWESLFVEQEVYDYRLAVAYADANHRAGQVESAIATCNDLLSSGRLPAERVKDVRDTRRMCAERHVTPRSDRMPAGRFKVVVPMRDPGPELDDLVESLLTQVDATVEVLFIDGGSREDHSTRVPRDRAGITFVTTDSPAGPVAGLDRHLRDFTDPDDIVVILPAHVRLATRTAVAEVLGVFARVECQVVYGQHRLPNGRLGVARPAVSEEDFIESGAELTDGSPIFFRASLWWDSGGAQADGADGTDPGATTWADRAAGRVSKLMLAAGWRQTWFADEALTVLADPVPPAGAITVTPGPSQQVQARHTDEPLVSCLMVTRDRVALAKRAIRCYAQQTYQHRELVIVNDGEQRARHALERFVVDLGLPNVRFVPVEYDNHNLGQLRNMAMRSATGSVVCQWDDDDCYHPDRIQVQLDTMREQDARACFLTDHLQFLEEDQALVWVDWTLGGRSGREQLLPGTLLMQKDDRFSYPEDGPYAQRGEDSVLLYRLWDDVRIAPAVGVGHLYLYTYHGRNTFDREHHYRLSRFGRPISSLEQDRDTILHAMAHYAVPKPYQVIGSDGPAFVLDG